MSDDDASLIYDRQGDTVVLTMNRPARRNALSLDMLVRLADAWEAIDADDSIRSAILTGAGDPTARVAISTPAGWPAIARRSRPKTSDESSRTCR
jgi:1,4-dihydroxy-2-naphthoyl-CoA synthase